MLHTFSLQQTPFLEQGWNDEDIMKKMDNHAPYETPQSEVIEMYMDHKICQGSTDPFNPGGEADSMEGANILEQFLHL